MIIVSDGRNPCNCGSATVPRQYQDEGTGIDTIECADCGGSESTTGHDECIAAWNAANTTYTWDDIIANGGPIEIVITPIDPDKLVFSVKTDNPGSSTSTQFQLSLNTGEAYNFDIDWGDGSSETITTNLPPAHEYGAPGTYNIQIGGVNNVFPGFKFGGLGDRKKMLEIKHCGSAYISFKTMYRAFWGCENLTFTGDALVNPPDTASVSIWSSAFKDCLALTESPLFDTSAATAFDYAFSNSGIIVVPAFNLSAAVTLKGAFYNCGSLTTVGAITISIVTEDVSYLLGFCISLLSFDVSNFNTVGVTTMNSMFRLCFDFDQDISSFSIAALTDATSMLNNSGFSQTNYDLLLPAWQGQPHNNSVSFDAGDAQYSAGAPAVAHAALVTDLWTITDGGLAA